MGEEESESEDDDLGETIIEGTKRCAHVIEESSSSLSRSPRSIRERSIYGTIDAHHRALSYGIRLEE